MIGSIPFGAETYRCWLKQADAGLIRPKPGQRERWATALRQLEAAPVESFSSGNSNPEAPAQLVSELKEVAPEAGPRFKVYPAIAAAALRADKATRKGERRRHVTGLLFWHLCRAFDASGVGRCETGALRTFAAEHGIGKSRFHNLLKDAQHIGAINVVTSRRTGVHMLIVEIRSVYRVAKNFGLVQLGHRAVFLPMAAAESAATWRAHLLAAWHEGRAKHPGPISSLAVRDETGIAPRTQRAYANRAGIRRHLNVCISTIPATPDNVEKARARRRAAHPTRNAQGQNVIAWPMANAYSTDYTRARRGQLRRTVHDLRAGLLTNRGGAAARIYHDSQETVSKLYRQFRSGKRAYLPGDLYLRQHGQSVPAGKGQRAAVWTPV